MFARIIVLDSESEGWTLLNVNFRTHISCYFLAMSMYQVTVANEHFSQTGEQEAPDVIEAWKRAVSSAIAIGGDQVSHGSPFFGAVITLAEGNKQIGRYVVSVGASPLKD